jgi:hypothetical protein
LSRGVYRPAFNDLIRLSFRVEMCTDNENGRKWKIIYNCCGGQTLLEFHADTPNERIAEVGTELENEPTFYRPVNLLPYYDRDDLTIELIGGDTGTHAPRSEE